MPNIDQDMVNAKFAELGNTKAFTTWLRKQVAEAHTHLPQYKGMWRAWELYRAKGAIITKRGVAVELDDIVLGDPEGNSTFVTIFSGRTGINTLVKTNQLIKL